MKISDIPIDHLPIIVESTVEQKNIVQWCTIGLVFCLATVFIEYEKSSMIMYALLGATVASFCMMARGIWFPHKLKTKAARDREFLHYTCREIIYKCNTLDDLIDRLTVCMELNHTHNLNISNQIKLCLNEIISSTFPQYYQKLYKLSKLNRDEYTIYAYNYYIEMMSELLSFGIIPLKVYRIPMGTAGGEVVIVLNEASAHYYQLMNKSKSTIGETVYRNTDYIDMAAMNEEELFRRIKEFNDNSNYAKCSPVLGTNLTGRMNTVSNFNNHPIRSITTLTQLVLWAVARIWIASKMVIDAYYTICMEIYGKVNKKL